MQTLACRPPPGYGHPDAGYGSAPGYAPPSGYGGAEVPYSAAPPAGLVACALLAAMSNASSGTASTASFAATNNAAAAFPERSGSLVGALVTFEAIGKMLGPALGAPLLSSLLATLTPETPSLEQLSGGNAADPLAADAWANGASATFGVFAAAACLFGTAALALPRAVDTPRQASLLSPASASTRSDDRAHLTEDEDNSR